MGHNTTTCGERKRFLQIERSSVLAMAKSEHQPGFDLRHALTAFQQQQARRWQHEENCPRCRGGLAA